MKTNANIDSFALARKKTTTRRKKAGIIII
jgi:hypothetical protein